MVPLIFPFSHSRAAKDNILEILKEATKKDANCKDGDSMMTPTLYAAYFGHIEALRLLVARGGEPDKADYFGNTALHLAAARGHELCVRFLVNFGCNIWSLDIDRHSARDLAAINGHERILQFLDVAQADQELNNRKKSRLMKEKAERDADKRLKEFVKRQKLAEVRAEKEQRRLLKETGNAILVHPTSGPSATTTFRGRLKPPPTYSDIVGTATKRHETSAVGRKALARRAVDDFKVVEIEVDGKRSVRSLTGVRRDSEVMYVGRLEANDLLMQRHHHQQQQQQHHQEAEGALLQRRGRISDVWGTLSRARSTPDLLGERNSCCDEIDEADEEVVTDEGDRASTGSSASCNERAGGTLRSGNRRRRPVSVANQQHPGSMFNRPGFGSVAFRRSVSTPKILSTFNNFEDVCPFIFTSSHVP
ncbi:hypothetical protein QAD02_014382 [Eretmocerus hayati]|uniref:Uncharacterized protein n=1 Tax=Eretmocerus hayati TaxID=131215 RepID=A0ACC2P4W5_9HYME|nr:hypothetical protein QAD02_014382 [Eretmocerus hayati]